MLNFRHLSIRSKLLVFFVLTSGAALLVACTAFVAYDVFEFRRTMVRDLKTVADGVAINSDAALDFGDATLAEQLLRALNVYPNITLAETIKADGTVFATYSRDGQTGESLSRILAPGRHQFIGPFLGGSLRVHEPVVINGEALGSVFIESDMHALTDRLRRYSLIVALVITASMLAALALAASLQGHISGAILGLAALAGEITTRKDYSLRARKESNDEVGQLIDSWNVMLDAVEKRDGFLRKTFGRYLSDEIVESLLESPEHLALGGGRRQVTILMTDLRGFTSLSERLEPEQVVKLLNNFLGAMIDVIARHQGTIDEFIGDAILVIFGAPIVRPDDALRAAACAVEMQLAMRAVNDWNVAHDLPEIEMGIGLNTGEVVVGNIGSTKRSKYAVVGQPINITARVESFTVGGQILVTDGLVAAVGDTLNLGRSQTITVKGVEGPFPIHELTGVGSPYSFDLAAFSDTLVPLATPFELTFTKVEGKEVGQQRVPAKVVALGERGAELDGAFAPEVLTNLMLFLPPDAGHEGDGPSFYGKVLDYQTSSRRSYYVRFTSVSPAVRERLARLRKASR